MSGFVVGYDGLKFPAVQVPSSDPNTLDDYEEGSYNPTATCSTSGTITLKGANDTLQYTKVGRKVHVHGRLEVASVSAPLGIVMVSLPFAAGAGTDTSADSPGMILVNAASSNVANPASVVLAGASSLSLYELPGTSAAGFAAKVQANTQIYISLTYDM